MFLPASNPLIHLPLRPTPTVAAQLQRCGPSAGQSGYAATFTGQMYTLEGAQRMAMRVRLEARSGGEHAFKLMRAPGLGDWHRSAPSVRVFRYLAQVTNLTGPTDYRALIDYRWLGLGGRVLRAAVRRTPPCVVPAAAADMRRPGRAAARVRFARRRRAAGPVRAPGARPVYNGHI